MNLSFGEGIYQYILLGTVSPFAAEMFISTGTPGARRSASVASSITDYFGPELGEEKRQHVDVTPRTPVSTNAISAGTLSSLHAFTFKPSTEEKKRQHGDVLSPNSSDDGQTASPTAKS